MHTVIRLILAGIVLCSATVARATESAIAIVAPSMACNMQPAGVDLMDFECPIEATGLAQRFRFTASFVGSHDDTSGSIAVHLNGKPLVCEVGSNTQLTGEFGEVNLDCKFQIKEKAGEKPLLVVNLKWFHARYTDADFVSE